MIYAHLGFNYNFDALNLDGEPNELNKAFQQIFKRPPNMSIGRVLMDMFPMLNIFVSAWHADWDVLTDK